MSHTNRYSDILAAFYETAQQYGSVGDEQYYIDAGTNANGPVLEAACGTGRIYLALRRRGVDIDGFDISHAMLKRLREKARAENLQSTVWQADLRSIGTTRAYEVVLMPFNSFCSLVEIDDQLEALESLHSVLDPGGRLLFDVFVPRYDVIAESFGEWQTPQTFTNNGRQLTARTRATIADEVKQTYRTEYQIRDDNGNVVAHEEFMLSHLPVEQIELLARLSPFDTWSVAGGFDTDRVTDGDQMQVWTLRKQT